MILFLILIIGTTTGYDFKCPVQGEWRIRANASCSSENRYVCLFNILKAKYEDKCFGADRSSKGSMLVFQPRFNIAECNSRRYQPIVFNTHGNSECILLKSLCDEEGQVLHSNGTSASDTTCRCDYRKRYAFVSKQKNSCFCNPSEEDCSCFRMSCKKLSPDYQCISDGEIVADTKCLEIQSQRSYKSNDTTDPFTFFIERNIKSYSHSRRAIYFIIAIIFVYIVLGLLKVYVFVVPEILSQDTIESDERSFKVKCKVRSYLPLTSVIWSKEPGGNVYPKTHYNIVGSPQGIWTLFFKPEEYDSATYKCTASNIIGSVKSKAVLISGIRKDGDQRQKIKTNEEIQNCKPKQLKKNDFQKVHFARLVFIGKNGVGKTSLMQRLLCQNKTNVMSTQNTDGIEIKECNINISNMEWSPCEKINNDLARLIHHVYSTETSNSSTASDENVGQECFDRQDDIANIVEQNHNEPDDESSANYNLNIHQMTSAIMESYLQLRGQVDEDLLASCWLWDFAGPNDLYATHQMFLSNRAVYLLVTDNLDFSTGNDVDDTAQNMSFWFNYIHLYCSPTDKDRLEPPVIVVCTHKDSIEEPTARKKQQDIFKENVDRLLKNQKMERHLRNIYFVSNTEDNSNVFEEIRNEISRDAMDMKCWGERNPLTWLLFQQVLEKLKESGVTISTTMKLFEIAKHDDIGITFDGDFKHCLQYCHNIGTVIYFDEENLKDHVILNPKWLSDAFKCLLPDKNEKKIKTSDDWKKLTDTGELTDSLISDKFRKEPQFKYLENKTHLLKVMTRLDMIVNLQNPNALYMPCMLTACSIEEVHKQFSEPFKKTSWFCLEFEFLPPGFFYHILMWYTKKYSVSVVKNKDTNITRHALYRHIVVFDLDSDGFEKLVICEGPNIVSLQQIWNSQMSDYTYKNQQNNLLQFFETIRIEYSLQLSYTHTFKCGNGNFTTKGKKLEDLLDTNYRCLEHNDNHSSDDFVEPWGYSAALQVMRFKNQMRIEREKPKDQCTPEELSYRELREKFYNDIRARVLNKPVESTNDK